MADKHLLHGFSGNRLDQISVESRPCVEIPVLTAGVGGKNDNRGCPVQTSRLISELVKTLYSVHLRHEMIHKYGVKMSLQTHLQCLLSGKSRVDTHIGIRKQPLFNLQIHLIIINDQNADLGCQKTALVVASLNRLLIVDIQFTHLAVIGHGLLYDKRKC